MDKKNITKSFKETQKLGKEFARSLLSFPRPLRQSSSEARKRESTKRNGATVLCLEGNLGGGKTTFLQGFAKGLGVREKVLSPTFVIMKHFGNFYHFDCYRINKPEEILELGWKEIIADPKNIVAVEWSEKIKKYIPKDSIKMNFKFISEKERSIEISGISE